MQTITPDMAADKAPKKEIKEGYFLCRVFEQDRIQPIYLCNFAVDGENGIVCAWEKDRVNNVDYYGTKMVIFPRLKHAEAVQQMIHKGSGPLTTAIFWRKWDKEINRYVTIQTNELKWRRAYQTFLARLGRKG